MNSHIPPIQHLLRQVELYKQRRAQTDHRPAWMAGFIDEAADFFEPVSDVARVGFDCQFDSDRWRVGLFLGQTERIGGRDDGLREHEDFDFDVLGLMGLFSRVESVQLQGRENVFADDEAQEAESRTLVSVSGYIHEQPLIVDVHVVAPGKAGPGFRMFPNGQTQPA